MSVDTVFCLTLIQVSKQMPKSKKIEKGANYKFQSQKGKKKKQIQHDQIVDQKVTTFKSPF